MNETPASPTVGLFKGPWEQRLEQVYEMMMEMSLQQDPQTMVERYAARVRRMMPNDGLVAVSRRGVTAPAYKITRSHVWGYEFNPWRNAATLPVLTGGVLGRLLDAGRPNYVPDLVVGEDDPAYEHLKGARSLYTIPFYDGGIATNMTFILSRNEDGFNREILPEQLWLSSLFGRVTHNLVLTRQVKEAFETVDKELKVVGEIQRSLLPEKLPVIPGLNVSAHYLTSRRAGGDYYDFFPLKDGRWGMFIADVSGHGTPAAVLMAVTHSIAHAMPGEPDPPGALLSFVNRQLAKKYTNGNGTFVTAFYGIFDPATKTLRYSAAGHPQPRLKGCMRGGKSVGLDAVGGLPLGIIEDEEYSDATVQLTPGDVLIVFTDGITESRDRAGELYGVERLDAVVSGCTDDAEAIIRNILLSVEEFTDDAPPPDDQTLIVARVS